MYNHFSEERLTKLIEVATKIQTKNIVINHIWYTIFHSGSMSQMTSPVSPEARDEKHGYEKQFYSFFLYPVAKEVRIDRVIFNFINEFVKF